jgi:tetratricopeptide (TPR) repeat protein
LERVYRLYRRPSFDPIECFPPNPVEASTTLGVSPNTLDVLNCPAEDQYILEIATNIRYEGADLMQPSTPDGNPADAVAEKRTFTLNEGILPEPNPEANRIALWLPGEREGRYETWERVSSPANAEFMVEPGIHAAGGTLIRARQSARGLFGKLFASFRKSDDPTWLLPNGHSAEQCGQTRNDILLVWRDDETTPLDQDWAKSRWPASNRFDQLGKNLYLVAGVEVPGAKREAEKANESPRQIAERLLAEARAASDRSREATALADLGAVLLHEGQLEASVKSLAEALAIVRQLGDRSREVDIMGNMGLIVLGQDPARAWEIFNQGLGYAREAGDRFAEKTALERMGLAYAKFNEATNAITCFQQALTIARDVGHRKHEADLLWYMAIQYAELGQRDESLKHGQAAIDIMEKMRNPQAAWYAEHLRKYSAGETEGGLAAAETGAPGSGDALLGGTIVAGMWGTPQASPQAAQGPGLLRMALSAAKSMAKFLGSGFKTAAPQKLQLRLRTCAACEHHTGLRCRLCGCFTNVKARMDHEECPIGKWPA